MEPEAISEPNKHSVYRTCGIAAVLVFFIPLIAGYFVAPITGDNPMGDLQELFGMLAGLSPLAIFIVIFLNNSIKALLAMVFGILAGIPTLLFLGFNGYIIGAVVSALQSEMSGALIAASLVPHGILEIAMIILSCALGLAVGMESIKYIFRRRSAVKATLVKGLNIYLKWVLAGLFIAAIIEVIVTPLIVLLVGGESLSLLR